MTSLAYKSLASFPRMALIRQTRPYSNCHLDLLSKLIFFVFDAIGWLVLDVSRAVRQWQKDYRTNQGLMVEVTEASSSHQVHPVALGLITTRQAPGDKEVRQILLLYDTASMSPLLL